MYCNLSVFLKVSEIRTDVKPGEERGQNYTFACHKNNSGGGGEGTSAPPCPPLRPQLRHWLHWMMADVRISITISPGWLNFTNFFLLNSQLGFTITVRKHFFQKILCSDFQVQHHCQKHFEAS